MNWIFLAILTAGFYGAYNIFIKLAAGHINEIVGAVILQIVAAMLGGGLLLYLKISNHPLEISPKGIKLAILAGVFVGLSEIFSFLVFSKGVSASSGIPIIVGGSILFASIISFFFLKENFNLQQGLGILLIILGVIALSANK